MRKVDVALPQKSLFGGLGSQPIGSFFGSFPFSLAMSRYYIVRRLPDETMNALTENKKARLEYEVLEEFEAGLELFGYEVKALRAGMASLLGSRVMVRGGEAYLVGATVRPYQEKNTPGSYDPERSRRLILHKKEIAEIASAEGQKGLTILPLMVYNKNRRLKLKVAIARHKKKQDKREALKERDTKRSIRRTLKNEE
jgi:SsrA-binding protein